MGWVKINPSEAADAEVKKGESGPIFGDALEVAGQPLHAKAHGGTTSVRSHINRAVQKSVGCVIEAAEKMVDWSDRCRESMQSSTTLRTNTVYLMVLFPVMFSFIIALCCMTSVDSNAVARGFEQGLSQAASRPPPEPVYIKWEAGQREVDMLQKVRDLGMLEEEETFLSERRPRLSRIDRRA
jgi:hypothetical protein